MLGSARLGVFTCAALVIALAGCEPEFQTRHTGVRALECVNASDCDDGVECTGEDCIGFHCIHVRYHRRCEGDALCLGPTEGCSRVRPCLRDADCVDEDECTVDEACDPDTRLCTFRYIGDEDEDGDVTPACGGGDCDDQRADVSIYRDELCDGVDNDCDDAVDENGPCGLGVCVRGECACDARTTLCDGECVRLASSVDHCGACGMRCAVGGRCIGGECTCPGVLEECGGLCQIPGTTRNACGPCQRACPPGAECRDGACGCGPSAPTDCGGACAELSTDRSHCGACARSCRWCEDCVAGGCVPREGYEICDGSCVDLSVDERHCGACGRACADARTCQAGECVCAAPAVECDGVCTNVLSDPANCGGCDVRCDGRCRAGECVCTTCPDGVCRDLSLNPDHCGACDFACGATQGCVGSACVPGGTCIERTSVCDVFEAEDEGLPEPPLTGTCVWLSSTYCTRGADGFAGAVRIDRDAGGTDFAPLGVFSPGCVTHVAPASVDWLAQTLVTCSSSLSGRTIATLGYVYDPGSFYADGARVEGALRASMVVGAVCSGSTCFARLDSDRGESRGLSGSDTSYFAAVSHAGDRWSIAGAFRGRVEGSVTGADCTETLCPTSRGGYDALLYRYVPSPASFPLTAFGGAGNDEASDVATLGADTVIVGSFEGTMTTPRTLRARGGRDAFVARVRVDGSVSWMRALGGAGDDAALAVAALGDGGVVVAGTFDGELEVGGAVILRASGRQIFVVALDAFGEPRWARALSGMPGGSARALLSPRLGLEVLASRIAIALGYRGTLVAGAHSVTSVGESDVALVVYDLSGTPVALRSLGSTLGDEVVGLAADPSVGTFWIGARIGGRLRVQGIGPLGPELLSNQTWLVGWRSL